MNQHQTSGTSVARGALASLLVTLIFALSIPVVSASSVNIALNPNSGVAEVTGVSTTRITFTYPANSTVSNFMKGYNYTTEASGNFAGGQSESDDFEHALQNYTSDIVVQNMSASLKVKATANSTSLVITRSTNINAWVSGVFNTTNGKVMADMSWKAFRISGAFNVPLDGREYDLNLMGSAVTMPLGGDNIATSFLSGSFGDQSIWSRSTIDFSSLNTPLTNWTKVYNQSTNTTTFTKDIKTQANYSSSVSLNGQTYSLSMVYDPSSTIKVDGYATAVGNSLIMEPSPAFIPTTSIITIIAVIVIVSASYMAIRRRKSGLSAPPPLTN